MCNTMRFRIALCLAIVPASGFVTLSPQSLARRSGCTRRVVDSSQLLVLQESVVTTHSLTIAFMQEVRDAIAPIFAPFFILFSILATPLFAVALIPLTVFAAFVGAAAFSGVETASIEKFVQQFTSVIVSVTRDEWIKLAACIALDFAGDASTFLPNGFAKGGELMSLDLRRTRLLRSWTR